MEEIADAILAWARTGGLRVTAILVAAAVGYQALHRVVDRALGWKRGKAVSSRRATLHAASLLALRVVIFATAVVLVLPELGFSVGPLIASLGVIGLALSFGAQTLVRDVVAGFFLLVEDLCRVGEDVEIGAHRGRVAGLQFRTLVLRMQDGALVYLPYGEVKTLVNYSRSETASDGQREDRTAVTS